MKIMITVLGILIILAGLLPLLGGMGIMPSSAITKAPGYYFVILAIGIIGLIYSAFNSMLFGFEKFVTMAIALLTILGGIIPFLQSFLPAVIPTSGPLYSVVIIVIGIIGLIYGFVALG